MSLSEPEAAVAGVCVDEMTVLVQVPHSITFPAVDASHKAQPITVDEPAVQAANVNVEVVAAVDGVAAAAAPHAVPGHDNRA